VGNFLHINENVKIWEFFFSMIKFRGKRKKTKKQKEVASKFSSSSHGGLSEPAPTSAPSKKSRFGISWMG